MQKPYLTRTHVRRTSLGEKNIQPWPQNFAFFKTRAHCMVQAHGAPSTISQSHYSMQDWLTSIGSGESNTRITLWVTCQSSTVETTSMHDSARAESGAWADWQACTTHAFLLDRRTSHTVFRGIVVFAMTTMAHSFTTHLTSFVVHRVRFGPDSQGSGPNPGPKLT